MKLVIKIGIVVLRIIYAFHKLAPVKNRVCVISRQHSSLSLDMQLVFEEIHSRFPEVECRAVCMEISPGVFGFLRYFLHMLGPEMHALATSRVVLLEGYVIPVSILNHKKSLLVVQMWHALGILKQFAFLSVGSQEGRNKKLAEAMHMHENYDIILTSSEFCRPYFAEAFGYSIDKLTVLPLPRVDLLKNPHRMLEIGNQIRREYPQLDNGKVNVLYAPTFRKGKDVSAPIQALINAVDKERYNLIIRLHPVDRQQIRTDDLLQCTGYSSMELFSVADVVISDYSALIYDAAVAGKRILLYTYDLEEYLEQRGFAIDYCRDILLPKYTDAEKLVEALAHVTPDEIGSNFFIDRFVEPMENCTEKLVTLFQENLQ